MDSAARARTREYPPLKTNTDMKKYEIHLFITFIVCVVGFFVCIVASIVSGNPYSIAALGCFLGMLLVGYLQTKINDEGNKLD